MFWQTLIGHLSDGSSYFPSTLLPFLSKSPPPATRPGRVEEGRTEIKLYRYVRVCVSLALSVGILTMFVGVAFDLLLSAAHRIVAKANIFSLSVCVSSRYERYIE